MKLSVYQLCRWCDAAAHGMRKWFLLGGSVLLALLCLLLRWHAPLFLLMLFIPVLMVYERERRRAFRAPYMRLPRPADAMCETVLIDASLIGQGTRLRAAAQPFDAADALSLRLGSGALLLGTAMVLTNKELPLSDQPAVLSAVRSLNLRDSRLINHNPVLRSERGDGLCVVTVRDGLNNRRYLVGSAMEVAAACKSIWEENPRRMEPGDLARIKDTMMYISQAKCRVWAYATALEDEDPIFLGMIGVGEAILPDSVGEVSKLRGMNLTLMLDKGLQTEEDLSSLRGLLELPDHHARADIHLTPYSLTAEFPLGISRKPGEPLSEPILRLQKSFMAIEDVLRRFGMMLALVLFSGFLTGNLLLPLCCAGILFIAYLKVGIDRKVPPLPLPCTLTLMGLTLFQALILSARGDGAMPAAGILPCALMFMSVYRLGGRGFGYHGQGAFWCYAALSLAIAGALFCAWLCIKAGVVNLLAVGFALLLSAAAVLLIRCEEKIFR